MVVTDKGMHSIGPAKMMQNNTTITSQPLVFHVVDAGSAPHQQSKDQQTNSEQQDDEYNVFSKLYIEHPVLASGQTTIATLKVFLRGNIVDLAIAPLSVPNTVINEVGEPKKTRETVDNVEYMVYEKKFLVTPSRVGVNELGPVYLAYSVQSFGRKRQKKGGGFFGEDFFDQFFAMPQVIQRKIRSDKLSFTVKELPPYDGRVDGIGDFTSFTMQSSQQQVHANEPVTLRLELVGQGNFDHIPDPELELPSDVRFYKSKATVYRDAQASPLQGKKIFEFVLQPKKVGVLRIPLQSFTFYNSMHGYKTLHTNEVVITVDPARDGDDATSSAVVAKIDSSTNKHPVEFREKSKKTASYNQDIHFINEEVYALKKQIPALPMWMLIVIVLLLLMLVWYSCTTIFPGKSSWVWFVRREQGKQRQALKKELDTLIAQHNASSLYQFFLRMLSFKYNYPIHDLTEQSIEQVLLKNYSLFTKVCKFSIFFCT